MKKLILIMSLLTMDCVLAEPIQEQETYLQAVLEISGTSTESFEKALSAASERVPDGYVIQKIRYRKLDGLFRCTITIVRL